MSLESIGRHRLTHNFNDNSRRGEIIEEIVSSAGGKVDVLALNNLEAANLKGLVALHNRYSDKVETATGSAKRFYEEGINYANEHLPEAIQDPAYKKQP